jgi:hypothetical protein
MKNIKNFLTTALLMMCIVFIGSAAIAQTDVHNSAYFTGSNYLTANNSSIGIGTSFGNFSSNEQKRTFEIWAKQDSIGTYDQTIIYNASGAAAYQAVFDIHINNDTLHAEYGNIKIKCGYPLDTNWHHIAFIIDSLTLTHDSISLYVDGTVQATTNDVFVIRSSFSGTGETLIGAKVSTSIGGTHSNYFKGNMSNLIITDSVLYTSSFTPNCVFDTALRIGDTIQYPTTCVMPMTNKYVYYCAAAATVKDSTAPITYSNTSPCSAIYDTVTYSPDSMTVYAHNINRSFNTGSYIPHILNGWDGTSVIPTYGLFTDSFTVTSDTLLIYTDENGDTSAHTAGKAPVSTNSVYVISQHAINIYPNPSYGTYTITGIHSDIIIYDMTGRIVKQYYVNGSYSDTLNAGIYIIRINNTSHKLIVN